MSRLCHIYIHKKWALMALAAVVALCALPVGAAFAFALPEVSQVDESVFRIATISDTGVVTPLGTGFAIGDEQPTPYVATNNHVIRDYEDNLYVWLNRDHYIKCTVLVALPETDIAVLKLDSAVNRQPLPLGSSGNVKKGDEIYAFGFPDYDISDLNSAYPKDVTVTTGTISKNNATYNGISYYQVDATLNPGNSGGPLWHPEQGVIGINTMKSVLSDNINGAVYIENLIDSLDLLGINYILTADIETPGESAPPATTPAPTMGTLTTAPAGTAEPVAAPAQSSQWLLILAIAMAGTAALLIVLALVLRFRDMRPREDERGSAAPEIPQPVQIGISPKTPERPKRVSQEAPAPPVYEPSSADMAEQDVMEQATKRVASDSEDALATRRLANQTRPVVRSLGGFFSGGVVPVGVQMLIGRDSGVCQLVYPMEMTQISRRHAAIAYNAGKAVFEVTDLSTNGTFMADGTRFVKNEITELKPGDQFYISAKEELFRVDLESI